MTHDDDRREPSGQVSGATASNDDDRRESSNSASGEERPASNDDDRRESSNSASGEERPASNADTDRRESSPISSGEERPASTDTDRRESSDSASGLSRRDVLAASVAGMGALAGCPGDGEGTPSGLHAGAVPQAEVRGSHHPGPPRFTRVGAKPLGERLHPDRVTSELSGVDGDLAPFNPVHGEDFSWAVADAPDDSSVSLGDTPVAHFQPDVPGTYTLELEAPDDTHELTVRAFPEADADAPQPRVTLSGSEDGDRYVFEADARPSPESDRSAADLEVEFYVDDRDTLEGELSVDGHRASVPADAVSGTLRVHAVAVGERHSVADFVRVEGEGSVTHPNEPPEWILDSTVYEIFVRRFGEDVTFEFLREKLDYIEGMGVDVIWLTPVLKAHSHQTPGGPGGPHGYDVTDYFETTPALGSREEYEAFVEACHDRGMKVIFDLVINHTGREHPYFQAAKNGTNVAPGNQEFFHDLYDWRSEDQAWAYFGWSGIPVVNYDSLALRSWILAVVDDWVDVVDGFRCDVAWGVPRSFWKEIRGRVKAEDPEFLLLDETIPWHSDFAEDQFGIHFDWGFFETLRAVGTGEEPARVLHDVVDDRAARGYPDHTAFMNYVENHDEPRYRAEADYPAQMAAGGATFTTPGTPMIYYGQETALNSMRSFMNWDTIDEDLKAYYERLVEARSTVPELAHDADFVPARVDGPADVVGYARETDEGRVLVLLNFATGTTTVGIPDGVETTDLLTGEDVSAEGGVDVTATVVLRADDRLGVGEPLAYWPDATGDVAATPEGVPAAALDCTAFDIQTTDDAYQFVWTLADAADRNHQHLAVYVGDGTGEATAVPELDADLAAPYRYRLTVGPDRAALVDADGNSLATPSVRVVGDEVRASVPRDALGDLEPMAVAPVVAAADGDGGVASVPGPSNVADLVTGPLTDQGSVLTPEGGDVTIPYTAVRTGIRNRKLDADLLAAFEDPTGDDHGPGEYEYPTSKLVPEGAFDLTGFEVYETDEDYLLRFAFRDELTNPKRAPEGFSLQHLQVYLRDPDADGGSTEAREGIDATFERPYHYRVAVDGYGLAALEGADGSVLSEDLSLTDVPGFDGVWVSLPKDSVGDISSMEVVPLVAHHDLSAPGRVSPVTAEGGIDTFGGARAETAPNVVDLVTPPGVSQAEALAYDADERATIPFRPLE